MRLFIEGKALKWSAYPHLQSVFEDFLLAQTFANAFNPHEMPRPWRQAQTLLSGVALSLQMRAYAGAAALLK
jgi:hypothetical protein